jgi:hypothetical protein
MCHKTGKLGIQFNKDGTLASDSKDLYLARTVGGRRMNMRNAAAGQSANRMRWSMSRFIQHHCLEMTLLNSYRENPFPFLQSFEKKGENNIVFSSPLCLVWRDPIQTPLLIEELPGQKMKFKCLVASGVRNTHIKITYPENWTKEKKTMERSKTARYMQYARDSSLVKNEDRMLVSLMCATKMYLMGLLVEGDVEILFWVAPRARFNYKEFSSEGYEPAQITDAIAEVKSIAESKGRTQVQKVAATLLDLRAEAERSKSDVYGSRYDEVWAKKVKDVNIHAMMGEKAIRSSESAFKTDSTRTATMEEMFLNFSSGEFNALMNK